MYILVIHMDYIESEQKKKEKGEENKKRCV